MLHESPGMSAKSVWSVFSFSVINCFLPPVVALCMIWTVLPHQIHCCVNVHLLDDLQFHFAIDFIVVFIITDVIWKWQLYLLFLTADERLTTSQTDGWYGCLGWDVGGKGSLNGQLKRVFFYIIRYLLSYKTWHRRFFYKDIFYRSEILKGMCKWKQIDFSTGAREIKWTPTRQDKICTSRRTFCITITYL